MLPGEEFEALSASYLTERGLRIIARRFRSRRGEIDLIALDGNCLVFVEVRARRSLSHGGALASVDRRKQCKISQCAAYFLTRHPEWRDWPCRFDVIAWQPRPGGRALEPSWIRNAFHA